MQYEGAKYLTTNANAETVHSSILHTALPHPNAKVPAYTEHGIRYRSSDVHQPQICLITRYEAIKSHF